MEKRIKGSYNKPIFACRVLFFCFANLFIIGLHAQQNGTSACNGTLGENIFTDGDFGRGAETVLQKDPLIAPGYTYTTNPPPYDGFYLITNDLAKWSNSFMDWFAPKDNSADPTGYMMVVNASVTPGLFYKQTITGLCENTKYVFSADVLNLDRIGLQNRIQPNVSFAINGVVKYSTGNVRNDQIWKTYDFTFATDSNQTTLELSLINNAPGGLGNDLALDNIAFRACGPVLEITPDKVENICEDGAPIAITAVASVGSGETVEVQWQRSNDMGLTWNDIPGQNDKVFLHNIKTAGTYYYRILAAGSKSALLNTKCRTISPVKIVNVVPKNYFVRDTICQGLSYNQAGKNYTTTGVFVDQLVSVFGCDSIITLDLTVVPQGKIDEEVQATAISCLDKKDGIINIEILNIENPPAMISLINSAGIVFPSFLNLAADTYRYTITDRFGCFKSDSAIVESVPLFTIDLGPDQMVDLGKTLALTGQTSDVVSGFQWDPVNIIDCNQNCLPYNFKPLSSVTLSVLATSVKGCLASDTINILVNEELKITLPNIISLAKDSENSLITLKNGLEGIAELNTFNIYDRWGNLIHQASQLILDEDTILWDGTTGDNKMVEQGVYPFILQATMINQNKKTLTGNITVVK